jgi:hypothetical protein
MINLAGERVEYTDETITEELFIAGVELVRADKPCGNEVNTHVTGRLGPYTFRRAWYYWVVKGRVPIAVAFEMYEHPLGRTKVRVGGHCGCPSPLEYGATFLDADGRTRLALSEKVECERLVASGSEIMGPIGQKILAESVFVEDPNVGYASAYVDVYHIDSQAGLKVFCDAIRKHGLA